MFNLDLEKVEKQEIKLLTSVGSQKKQENSRKTNLEIADLQKKSEEFDKQQKKEKAEYDARVAKQVAENARRKAEYEAAVAKQAQENARRKAERDAAIKRQVANENAKHFNAPTKSSKANKKLSDFSICIHAIYKGYDVCCVTSKVTNNILPLYQPGFTFFDVLKNGNLSKIKEYVKDPVVLGYFVVGVFVSQFCGEEIFKMSLKEKKDTIQFLKERLSPESYKQITSDTNLHKDILESLWDKEFVDLIKRIGLFDDYLSCFNIENALDEQSNAPLTLSILPDDKEEASLTASLNFDIDLEEMKIDDFSYLDLFFDLNPYSQNYDFFNDMESSDVGTIVCQLPYRFFNKELPNSYDLQASFNNDITEAEKEYVRDSLESECPNNLEDYEDIYEYIDCLSQGDRVNLLKDGKHYLIMKMPLGIFESLNCNDGHDCSDIDFDSECYTNDIYMDCRKEYFSSDYFLLGKKQIKKQTKLTKEELVEMILSKLGKDPKELEESNEGLKLLDYYYKRYGDTDYISDLRALLFETPYLFFDYLDVETPWYSPNYVKEFDYNLKEKQPNPFWQPEKKLNEEYKKRCVEYFKHYKTNIGNDSNVEKEYKAMLDHIITNVVYSRNGSIEEQDLSVLSNITGIKITMSDIGTHKSQEKTSVVKKEQPMKDGDIYVDYLYCDEDSACQVIKLIYRIAVNKKHKIQTDIYSLRYEAAYAFSSDFDSFETYRFEEDPNILYDEVIDARDLGDISAHLDNLEFDDFSLEDLDKLNPEEYDELYNQVYFKVDQLKAIMK